MLVHSEPKPNRAQVLEHLRSKLHLCGWGGSHLYCQHLEAGAGYRHNGFCALCKGCPCVARMLISLPPHLVSIQTWHCKALVKNLPSLQQPGKGEGQRRWQGKKLKKTARTVLNCTVSVRLALPVSIHLTRLAVPVSTHLTAQALTCNLGLERWLSG